MDVGASGDVEEEFGEGEGERVAHGVDEDVGDEEAEGVPGEDQRAQGLSDEGEAGPCGGGDPMASGEEDEEDAGGVEVDVEAVLVGVSVYVGGGGAVYMREGEGEGEGSRYTGVNIWRKKERRADTQSIRRRYKPRRGKE